jgi:SulP family sulfate permease
MGPGTVVGELGVYLNRPTTASVVANQESVLYFLPNERFQDLEKSDPAAAAELHRLMVQLVGERLLFSLSTLQALSK